MVMTTNEGDLGDYKELAVLPDKIACYLYEYHADDFAQHRLPPLPEDRSHIDAHGILQPEQVILITSTYIAYCTSFTYGTY